MLAVIGFRDDPLITHELGLNEFVVDLVNIVLIAVLTLQSDPAVLISPFAVILVSQ